MTVWLPVVGALIGLVGTALGWSLNQLSQWFAFRRERKKTMAKAIYGMLQIRDRVRMLPEAVRAISEKLQIAAAEQVALMAVFENFFLEEDGFAAEFEASIAVLADYDPVLAARMRNKNQIAPLLKKLRQMVVASPGAATFWAKTEGQIMNHGLPRFDEAVLELAALHGRRMKKQVETELERKIDVPEEILAAITDAIQQQVEMQHREAVAQQKGQKARDTKRVPVWAAAEQQKPQS